MAGPRACIFLWSAVALATMCCAVSKATPPDLTVQCQELGGRQTVGTWIGMDNEGRIRVMVDTQERVFPAADLDHVLFVTRKSVQGGAEVVYFNDGGWMRGQVLQTREDNLVVTSPLGPDVALPLKQLAAMQFTESKGFEAADALFRDAMGRRPPGEDVLITREAEEPQPLRGRLDSLDASSGSFHFAGKTRGIQREKIYAVVLARGASQPEAFPARVTLIDGGNVCGRLLASEGATLSMDTSVGAVAAFGLEQVRRIDFQSDRIVYLSELSIADRKEEGLLHQSWPLRLNRSVSNGPLRIAGQSFEKGIGCHSRTVLSFDLAEPFESFAATVGIDNAVRPAGDASLRVLGDDRVLLADVPVTGRDAPRDLLVDVRGIKRLTLETNYGEALDLSDHVNWGEARLIRPARK